MIKTAKKIGRGLYLLISALLVIGLGAALAWAMHLGASKLPLRQYFPTSYTNAVWDWSDPEAKSQQDINNLSDFMYLHQLNSVYIDVGDRYESILNTTDPAQKAAEQQRFENSLNAYVGTLGKRGIKVFAAAGDVSWSEPDNQHIPLAIMRAVEGYNEHHPHAQLAGMEFDIEAYNQPGFSDGSMTVKSLTLTDWLDMVDQLAAEDTSYVHHTSHSLELGFAIPYWFDDENGNIPAITWHNQTGPTLFHVLDRLNQLPESNVVVMAYRNAAKGNDGIIYHARTEVEYATSKAPHVHVIIGQEVNDVQPAKITYYGESMAELSGQVTLVEDEFRQDSAFGGIAVNDLPGYQQMTDGD